jgi:hypothetical protein
VVACLWEQEPAGDHVQRVVPDGCVDLIWKADRELVIAGADTGPRSVRLPAGARSSGIRLRPGAADTFLGLPASELRDLQVAVALGRSHRSVPDRLQGVPNPPGVCERRSKRSRARILRERTEAVSTVFS